jgi:two-component system nitrate/nitrite response regulator NarL
MTLLSPSFIIVHPNRLLADLWSWWIAQQFPGCRISQYTILSSAFDNKIKPRADLCIFDATNAQDDWEEFVDEANYKKIARKILILSGSDSDCHLARLRPARLDGILDLNEYDMRSVSRAIRTLLAGGTYISPRYRQALFERTPRRRSSLSRLTSTETLVLASIGVGLDKNEISEEMRISPSTVSTHRRNIMRKLGISREGQLVAHAFYLGLVTASSQGLLRPGFEMSLSTRNRLKRRARKIGGK